MTAVLYVVGTPIGNLDDITARAAETLRAADRVVAEDTRRTRTLLTHLGVERKPLTSLEAHAGPEEIARVVGWLSQGQSVAVVTDAGMPSVSDPGSALVRAAAEAGVRVIPIPGPSAVTAAIAASGLADGGFRFFGFLPRSGSARADALAAVLSTPETVVFFEAPTRMAATLAELATLCPARPLVVAREMTKLHEELLRGTVAEVSERESAREWLGEVTLVLGADHEAGAGAKIDDERVMARIREELARGETAKTVAQRVAAWSGRPRREIYERVLDVKGRSDRDP
ncbi:MAG TPA: 16S rRNA (cytidine(1402)-2'-O)-methyltransferase [Polyangiaceae bacterium]|nr:16S rRNA (cytidine(1402)-2'-O)-methyltransferase [Polyangiaceae bacterium]